MWNRLAFRLPWRVVSWCIIRAGITVFETYGLQDEEMEKKVKEFVETYNWIHTGWDGPT